MGKDIQTETRADAGGGWQRPEQPAELSDSLPIYGQARPEADTMQGRQQNMYADHSGRKAIQTAILLR